MTDETPFSEPDEGTAIDSPILARMLAHWRALAGGRAFPQARDLDPVAIPWALGRLTLIDVVGDIPAPRFRYALCGDRHVAHFGNDLTGTWLDDNPNPEVRARAAATYVETLRRRAPVLGRRDIAKGPRMLRYQALILPLGEADGRVERLIVVIDFDVPMA
ncbi:MAG: PAS domain-containing protein [Tagaea sp.]|nr:PAS domain-containing protein [Tagaea sp.]